MLFQKNSGAQWIVAFLGNPGVEYENTRHNAGFLTAHALEKAKGIKINRLRFRSLTALAELGGSKTLVMMPQTYMNLSGEAVGEAARFYKIPADHVLVVSDEMALPVGKMRVRPGGSAGGHNGLKNIIQHLGTDAFPRIRLGIGEPPREDYDPKDWVLSVFRGHDAEDMAAVASRCAEAVEYYIQNGPDKTMNRYN
jgi:PTH1 family peptidyl-tRNA hydrolase